MAGQGERTWNLVLFRLIEKPNRINDFSSVRQEQTIEINRNKVRIVRQENVPFETTTKLMAEY